MPCTQRPTLHGNLQKVSPVTLFQVVISLKALNCTEKVEADQPPDKHSMSIRKTECLVTILMHYTCSVPYNLLIKIRNRLSTRNGVRVTGKVVYICRTIYETHPTAT
jgi:hypothetical protein